MPSADALVTSLEQELHDQPANPLRPHQIEEYQAELRRQGGMAQGRNQEGAATGWVPADRGAATATTRRIRKLLDEQTAKPISEPMRRDRVARLMAQVRDEVVRPAMLPQETMRRNPPGAVTQFMKSENSTAIKRATIAVKRAMFALEQPDSNDRDFASTEKWRPVGAMPGQAATFVADAQIPGNFAMTPLAKENTPFQEPTINSALKQVQAREAKEKKGGAWTPERRAAASAKWHAQHGKVANAVSG